MKLTKRDLSSFFAKPTAYRAVLFFGPDEGQSVIYRKQALSSLLVNPSDALATTQLNGDKVAQEPSVLFEAMSALSLLGDAPLVVIDHASDKCTAIIKEALSIPECKNFLIVVSGDLPARSTLRILFERDKSVASFACYRDEGADLSRFIESTLRERGVKTERDALYYLCAHLGNDRGVTMQEIEKICLYSEENKSLSLRDAMLLVGNNETFSADDLCLALGNGNFSSAMALAEKLLAEGENAISLLRAALRHFDRLKHAKYHAMKNGGKIEDAMGLLKPPVFYKHKAAFGKQLASLSEQKILRALAVLQMGENSIKHSKDQRAYFLQALTLSCRICA